MIEQAKTCGEYYRTIQNRKWLVRSVIAFVLVVAGALAHAQESPQVSRLGMLIATSLSAEQNRIDAFLQGLRELGYIEGKNLAIERRYAEGNFDRLPDLGAELVRLKVAVIVTTGSTSTRAAKKVTTTIPIVMGQDNDPVGNGFVASLARPGGNITGLSSLAPDLSGKQLELLKEIVPKLSRVAIFAQSTNPTYPQSLNEVKLAASAVGVKLQLLDIIDRKQIEDAFRAARKDRADAFLALGSPIFVLQRKQFADLAVKNRLPGIHDRREFVDDGGLMSYATNFADLSRRAATYVDKILKGTKPSELPVEQPKKFEFIINLKAAKQIGLTIPPNVLARADKVIR
jgi:putative ABC transport system substrate-binding protein